MDISKIFISKIEISEMVFWEGSIDISKGFAMVLFFDERFSQKRRLNILLNDASEERRKAHPDIK